MLTVDMFDDLRTRENLAWAAGLFEGEGCFTTARRGDYLSCAVTLGMTDKDRVVAFHKIVGVGNITTHNQNGRLRTVGGKPTKPIHVWKTGSVEGVQAVVAMLWPWLGPRRKAKAKEILVAYREQVNVRRFALARPDEVQNVKQLLTDGVSKRTIARLVGRSYGFVNSIKSGRTHGEANQCL